MLNLLVIGFMCVSISCSVNRNMHSDVLQNVPVQNGSDTCKHYYDSIRKNTIYTEVTVSPSFPGGNSELYNFIRNRLTISPEEFKYSNGKVIAEFIVEMNGELTNVKIFNKEQEYYSTLDKKIIAIIDEMPEWKPGKCNDNVITYLYRLPIVF